MKTGIYKLAMDMRSRGKNGKLKRGDVVEVVRVEDMGPQIKVVYECDGESHDFVGKRGAVGKFFTKVSEEKGDNA